MFSHEQIWTKSDNVSAPTARTAHQANDPARRAKGGGICTGPELSDRLSPAHFTCVLLSDALHLRFVVNCCRLGDIFPFPSFARCSKCPTGRLGHDVETNPITATKIKKTPPPQTHPHIKDGNSSKRWEEKAISSRISGFLSASIVY